MYTGAGMSVQVAKDETATTARVMHVGVQVSRGRAAESSVVCFRLAVWVNVQNQYSMRGFRLPKFMRFGWKG